MRTVALLLLFAVLVFADSVATPKSFTNEMGESETVRPASPSTFIPNKMGEDEAIKLATRLTYGMAEKEAIQFLKQNGLAQDLPSIGDSFAWSDGFSFSKGVLCLTIAPKRLQANGEWVNGLLKEAVINNNDGKRISIALKNAP
jgi:hypothetical protein